MTSQLRTTHTTHAQTLCTAYAVNPAQNAPAIPSWAQHDAMLQDAGLPLLPLEFPRLQPFEHRANELNLERLLSVPERETTTVFDAGLPPLVGSLETYEDAAVAILTGEEL